MPPVRFPARAAVVLFCGLSLPAAPTPQAPGALVSGHVISGRLVDPHQLRPEDAVLMLGREDYGSFSSTPVPVDANGSFVTPRLGPGTYVLEVVRTPHSSTKRAAVVGFS